MTAPSTNVSRLALLALWLAPAGAAFAQEAAAPAPPVDAAQPARDMLLELPPIPELEDVPPAPPEAPLPRTPVVLDPELIAPLPPRETFNPAPRDDIVFAQTPVEGVRYRVQVEGLEPTGLNGDFRRLSALHRGQNRPATPAQLASRANSDRQLLERMLFSEGWYGATVELASDFSAQGQAEIRLIVVPGERYTWRQITLDLIPADRPELAEGFGLAVGDPIRARAVEEAEGALLVRLNEAGYPFAEIGVRDVVLDQGAPTGTYLLTGDLGPAAVFGPIRMAGYEPFEVSHAEVIARFQPGAPYDARLVDDFRRALIATQQFGGVTVTPVDTGLRDAQDRAVTEIRIQGNRGPQRLLTGQIGFATEEGFRAEGAWRNRQFLRPEGVMTARLVLGTEEQRASATLAMGNWRQRDRSLVFEADVANLSPPAYNAQQVVVGVGLERTSTPIWQKLWTWGVAFGLGYSREESRALQRRILDPDFRERRDFLFATLPANIGYDRSNDLLDPTAGFRLRLDVEPELSREAGRVQSYLRSFLEGRAYQSVGADTVLAGRLRAGTIVGADLLAIAPTRRLYAGGGGSVRGFDYQAVGTLGLNGRPIGGRGLIEGSAEVRHRFGDFGVVGFVDAGSVTSSSVPSFDGMRFGVGVGGRYFTAFGPVRIDVARAINRGPSDPPFALYISIGQSF